MENVKGNAQGDVLFVKMYTAEEPLQKDWKAT